MVGRVAVATGGGGVQVWHVEPGRSVGHWQRDLLREHLTGGRAAARGARYARDDSVAQGDGGGYRVRPGYGQLVCVHVLVLGGVEVGVADVDQAETDDGKTLVSIGVCHQLCVHLWTCIDLDLVFEDAVFKKELGDEGQDPRGREPCVEGGDIGLLGVREVVGVELVVEERGERVGVHLRRRHFGENGGGQRRGGALSVSVKA